MMNKNAGRIYRVAIDLHFETGKQCVLIANIIAWPFAWYAMNKWLQNFAYRISIGWRTFLLAGALALVIALLTVSYQAIKAATANPVKSLRHE